MMSAEPPDPREYIMSSHLSAASVLAMQLSRDRSHRTIEVPDYVAACYIADPLRFLTFWSDQLSCMDNLGAECGLTDAVWTYQWSLMEKLKANFQLKTSDHHPYAKDLRNSFVRAAQMQRAAGRPPEIDLPHVLLALREDNRLQKLFSCGFREDLALKRAR